MAQRLTRRQAAGVTLAAVIAPLRQAVAQSGEMLVYVGTFTQHSSKGIYAFRFQASPPKVTSLGLAAEASNPSFLIVHPNRRFLYSVSEDDRFQGRPSGAVSAYAIDPGNGRLTLLNQVATHSPGPCHLALDKTARWLFVANYAGGSVTEFPVQPDGSLGENSAFIQHRGSSVDHERQSAPHAHQVVPTPDNQFVLVPDLGLDEVLTYRLEPARGTLSPGDPPFTRIAPGSGPRHLAFHPSGKLVYVANELTATVAVYTYDAARGHLQDLVETVAMVPKDYIGPRSAAEIAVSADGRFLYASNRGHDSIAVFAIDPYKGTLTKIDYIETGGKTPRNFAFDASGDFLFVANQDSNNVVLFRRNSGTGKAIPLDLTMDVPNPVCIVFR
jgi:6-phosphogluconolactonase